MRCRASEVNEMDIRWVVDNDLVRIPLLNNLSIKFAEVDRDLRPSPRPRGHHVFFRLFGIAHAGFDSCTHMRLHRTCHTLNARKPKLLSVALQSKGRHEFHERLTSRRGINLGFQKTLHASPLSVVMKGAKSKAPHGF